MNEQTIETMKAAQHEIRDLRRRNEILGAKVEVFDQLMCLLHTQPAQRPCTASPDVLFQLDKQIMELEEDLQEARRPKQQRPPEAAVYAPR